jgi:DNA (cytosine-5)-methyltransferase 1
MALTAVDLFAGAGGCSTGLLQAASRRDERVSLVAVNHWPIAVETHRRNHPDARHFCQAVETVDPREAVPSGTLDLLIAAPECTHHSAARGGRPMNDQSRASAWHVLRWLELLQVREVLLENVAEFQTWGPLGRNQRPLKSRRGETFRAFVAAIESYGYRVEWKVLNAADYGAATTRRRLFLRASKRRGPIAWPAPTHSKTGSSTLFGGTKRWRAAREVIDWSLPSQSIFTRKKPLRPATMRRIMEGLRRFGGEEIKPFLLGQQSGAVPRPVTEPVPTVATDGAIGLIEPFLTEYYGNGGAQSVNEPVPTVTTHDRFALVQPVVNGLALDIRFRMLQPHELSAAMSFPTGYAFAGNKGDAIKQIGNAVDCAMAAALCGAILDSLRPAARPARSEVA